MSKGSRQRPRKVTKEQFNSSWDTIFNSKPDQDVIHIVVDASTEVEQNCIAIDQMLDDQDAVSCTNKCLKSICNKCK